MMTRLWSVTIPSTILLLRIFYGTTTGLCIMMSIWVLFVPGSWMFGRSEFHDYFAGLYLKYLEKRGLVPSQFFTKYQGHTAVHMTHLLPSALWSALIPFQLHSGFRKNHPRLHRWMGYLFVSCSFLIVIGLCIILQRGLLFENSFPDLPPLTFSFTKYLVIVDMIYFLVSALYSLYLARNRLYMQHRNWIIRHIASGLFVAWQRILIAVVFGPMYPPPVSRIAQRSNFGQAGWLGLLLSLSCAEYAIHLLHTRSRPDQSPNVKMHDS